MRHQSLLAALATVAATAMPATAGAAPARAPWHDCPTKTRPQLQCMRVQVPLDRSRPGGRTISLAVNRIPATGTRTGSLLVNPGGPGGSGTGAVAGGLLRAQEYAGLREHFDIVGFDPRGVGQSARIRCRQPLHDPDVNRFPVTRRGFDALRERNRAAGRSCTPGVRDHVDTANVADDMDAIRAAIGDERISYLGVSYGSELGATYAQRHPHRVRAMVLDGVVDHAASLRSEVLLGAVAHERALDRFAAWCRDRCTVRDVPAAYDAVLRRAAAGTLRADGKRITAEEATAGAYQYLAMRSTWPALDRALAAARTGDAGRLVAQNVFDLPGLYDPYRAIGCQDFGTNLAGPTDVRHVRDMLRRIAPHTWRYSEWWDWASGCVGWPAPVTNPPRPKPIHPDAPLLLVGNTGDPATPYPFARSLAARIPGSILLTYRGDGHTALFNSSCGRRAETRYLASAQPPAEGSVCTS